MNDHILLVFFLLQACIIVSSFLVHFSPSVHGAILGLVSHFNTINLAAESESLTAASSLKQKYRGARISNAFHFVVVMNMESASLFVDLENETENSRILFFYLKEVNIRYVTRHFSVLVFILLQK